MTYQRNETPEPMASTDICPECGAPLAKGEVGHYVEEGEMTVGFWTCPKFYKDGVRIDRKSILKEGFTHRMVLDSVFGNGRTA